MKKGPVLGTGIGFLILFLIVFGITYVLVARSIPSGGGNLREAVEQERKLRGEAVSTSVARGAVDPLLEPGIESDIVLDMLVDRTKEQNKDVVYIYIQDRNGKVSAKTEAGDVQVKVPPGGLESLGSQASLAQALASDDGVAFFDVAVPVAVGNRKIGEVHTGILAPKIEARRAEGPLLPKFILTGAAGVVGVLFLIVLGVRSLKRAVPPEVTEYVGRIPELREEEEDLTRKIAQKREEVFSLTKDLDDKRKEVEEKRKQEEEVAKRLESRKKEEAELPAQAKNLQSQLSGLKNQVSKATEELAAVNQRVKAMKEEEHKLREKIEATAAAAAASASKMKAPSPAKLEAKKREELELIQRIVGKRREEIAISQRIEAKRKEGIDLVRQIEALKKQLASLDSKRSG